MVSRGKGTPGYGANRLRRIGADQWPLVRGDLRVVNAPDGIDSESRATKIGGGLVVRPRKAFDYEYEHRYR